ncbi:hypothetical protein OG339_47315 (plasmid) [Streptosporangium sp. NBC_01495]|uniref:hypothetical protein n=1 Tax=Streptosporangium sp. NBC_01495 TaxID=2903899 RepID=UPI002E3635AC|nr:hypothetical protein [Streptosporangium sp. NBC_01495]
MSWHQHAEQLAAPAVVPAGSRWHGPIATVPRRVFLPHWRATPEGAAWGTWQARAGVDDETAWLEATLDAVHGRALASPPG